MRKINEKIITARKEAALILYKVINSEISARDAVENYFYRLSSIDKSVDSMIHALYHYRDDEDIRKKDKKYAELQINDLKAMANNLSQGLPIPKKHFIFYTPHIFSIKSIFIRMKRIFTKK